jgi:hypothetical protein
MAPVYGIKLLERDGSGSFLFTFALLNSGPRHFDTRLDELTELGDFVALTDFTVAGYDLVDLHDLNLLQGLHPLQGKAVGQGRLGTVTKVIAGEKDFFLGEVNAYLAPGMAGLMD